MALTHYLSTFLLIALFRAADLYLTWRITPDLKYELNPLVRKLSWRTIIYLNVAVCILTAVMPQPFLLAGCLVSAIVIVWNIRILWLTNKHLR